MGQTAPDPGTATGAGGGSATGTGTPRQGGGYLETCRGSESEKKRAAGSSADQEWIEALAASGVGRAWVRVAERIGFDAFMAMWSELDGDESLLDERRRVRVPQLDATLFRLQRVRIIRALGDRGMSAPEILRALPRNLRVRISRRTVQRILRD